MVKATKVNAGLAESNGRLLLGIWRDSLHVTCGLTACTPGSAPGPTLANEYGKTLPFYTTSLRVGGRACDTCLPGMCRGGGRLAGAAVSSCLVWRCELALRQTRL